MQASVSWPVLSQNGIQQWKYVDPCYLTHLWDFLDDIDTHLQFDFDQWLYPQWQHDTFIIEMLSQIPGITKNELVHAQCCHLYLRAATMADICTSNGQSICKWAFNGQAQSHTSNFTFSIQSQPGNTVWKTWKRLLQICFCSGTNNNLTTPLGKWYCGCIMQVWNMVIDPHTLLIYVWGHNNDVWIYERQGRSMKKYRYMWPNLMNSFHLGCVPVSGQFQAGTFIITGYVTTT